MEKPPTQNQINTATAAEASFAVDSSLSAEELFTQGEYYFNHDDDPAGPYDINKADLYYKAAIRKDPLANKTAWYQLGRVEFIKGRFNSALDKFAKQVEYFPDAGVNPNYMVGLVHGYHARQTLDEADWLKAEAAFKDFIKYEPRAPWPRVDLAWAYFAQGKYEAMLPVLGEGLLYDANNAWLHNMYGLALLNTGESKKAVQHFGFAATLAESLTPADWGESYPGNNPEDWDQGLREFKTAIQKNRTLAEQKLAN